MANNITLSKTQFYALVVMNIIGIISIIYAAYTGTQDRAIIKRDIGSVLGNISESERIQVSNIQEIRDFEAMSEERSTRLLPPFERMMNETVREQQRMLNLLGNQTVMQQDIKTIINLLNGTN